MPPAFDGPDQIVPQSSIVSPTAMTPWRITTQNWSWPTSSGAEELARKIPKARVVLAFNTVPNVVLFGVYEARREANRPSQVYCGDDRNAKELAAGLISDVGFDPVDAGPLQIARYMEHFVLLVGQLAYEGEEGPEPAYRFERFGR